MFGPSTLWRPDAVPQMRLGLGQSWQMHISQHSLAPCNFFIAELLSGEGR